MGGERLNIAKNSRLPWAVCLFLILFSAAVPRVSAQTNEPGQEAENVQPLNPLLEVQQNIALPDGTASGQPNAAPRSSVVVIIQMLLVLALAAAAIYGVVFFIKKASRRPEVQDPYLKVLASAHLGSGRYAHVLSLGSKAWLIGSADGGVELISDINEPDILNAMLLDDSKKSAGLGPGGILDFKSILGRMGFQVKSSVPGAENIRKRRERIKGW